MQKRRLFGKYFELRYIWCVLFCCAVLFLYVPLLGDTYGLTSTYCEVLLDGDVIGAVSDPSAVDQAFLNARAQIAREKNGLVLANVECDFRQVDKLVGSTLEPGELESVIHDLLQEKIKIKEGDGLKALDFFEKVEIAEAYIDKEHLTDLSEAVDSVTKEKEKNQTYEVQPGDTLSVIANSRGYYVDEVLALNPGLTRDTVLHIGDEIIISVPEPELSILVSAQSTYEEDYYAETQYIENDSWYTTETVVRQEAQAGHHAVTVLTVSKNDTETEREIIEENVLVEPVPEIIEKGTQTPPTYMKPITGGRFTSGFKMRWGRMHKGVDWATPVGTTVRASCGGTVVSAGWASGYGYCVLLSHPDGRQTRYGHLSKILVSPGQKVDQNQKIALSGNTGRSTGPHCHFEVRINGSAVDPLSYVNY